MTLASDQRAAVRDLVDQSGHTCEIDGKTIPCSYEAESFTPEAGDGVSKDFRQGSLHIAAEDVGYKPPKRMARIVVQGVPCEVVATHNYVGEHYHIEYMGAAR